MIEAAINRGWDAAGIDVSASAVEFCRKRNLPCRLVDGNVLPFPDGSFDMLTAWHVIEHVADVEKTLADWFRVLRPNGVLALETPDASSPIVRLRGSSYRKFWRRSILIRSHRRRWRNSCVGPVSRLYAGLPSAASPAFRRE